MVTKTYKFEVWYLIFGMIYFKDKIIYILRHYYILCTRLTSLLKDVNLPHGSLSLICMCTFISYFWWRSKTSYFFSFWQNFLIETNFQSQNVYPSFKKKNNQLAKIERFSQVFTQIKKIKIISF